MKAVILLAGTGSRLHPLTLNTPKSLLPIGDSSTLEHMVTKLAHNNISSFVIITGHMQDVIKDYLLQRFPDLEFTFITNELYKTTNTGYSLLLAEHAIGDDSFIKLDGDVTFDEEIIERLVRADDSASYVCVDASDVDEEVIKVKCDENGNVIRIGNKISLEGVAGESIGIERISSMASPALFACLKSMLQDTDNYQNYYEVAYDTIIQAGVRFKIIDITGLHWVEMDNHDDYRLAQKYFA